MKKFQGLNRMGYWMVKFGQMVHITKGIGKRKDKPGTLKVKQELTNHVGEHGSQMAPGSTAWMGT
jgi:hypothetical protein